MKKTVWVAVDPKLGSCPAADCVLGVWASEEELLEEYPNARPYGDDDVDPVDDITYTSFEVKL